MRVGIVGFPRSGKSTVFAALTGLKAEPGAHREAGKPHLGAIKVPDERIDRLAEIFRPRKTTFAEIVFLDFPGGDHAGSAVDRATLVQMRDADALVQVVRGFDDPVTGDEPNPVADIANFQSELILADLQVLEKRLERLRKEKGKEQERSLVERCHAALEGEKPLRQVELSPPEEKMLAGFGLLSRLPILAVLNVAEGEAGSPLPEPVQRALERDGQSGIPLCASIEMEIAALDAEDRGPFLADLGLADTARDRFVRAAYSLLDLVSFLTTGEDEVRAWPIRRGTTAVRAAGKIHSDIERGFIRAEVVPYQDFIRLGSEARCREAGKLRLEGKDYVVQDGDIIHFRFNV